ncbi:Fur family ferric uptake transcriptional regulator [Parabacteroides sp. PF5-5]|uniref:Fur family transcriptional regulator n=1 Tax=unclassified Parabacteroides TaxID=2649774 RepID=UPI002473606A|nr:MULTISPECIES: Fur family transcriptional regulator [unclassified Parabacteroides]MDH6305664.1 Fur family ferric uptake transcriptional regulator [Parabacteroides sp. PH5-39]MDH6316736.1 Fur family ferric uptake transcriptional regulator [Parabacteroides sp. PF5-13]MDH6320377.1 Fur family ferric uptake transcriptional regulator [Parabacteroides sp. PH5-13]MDH6324107.1 Fur family ferric uptake transcriptional regulator [Parabacteroides sp. PH5-8]MDH6327922.1 Fur family ferric uptake transcrip
MDSKIQKEIRDSFTAYLTEKKLRKTKERYAILEEICNFSEHFDIITLHQRLLTANFHVSKATLYNTVDVLTDAGIIVRHQVTTQLVQYELRRLADSHLHLICMKCSSVRELKNAHLKGLIHTLKTPRFTPVFHSLYIYGLCARCKNKQQKELNKRNK